MCGVAVRNLTTPPRPSLQDLVPLFGISKSGDGFDLAELMEWVGKTYASANAGV